MYLIAVPHPPQLRRHVVIALRHQPRRFWSRLYFISLYSTTMPSELLHAPPLYTLVGIYRLLTDPQIRGPVLDKVKHASVRGLIVGLIYAIVSWRPLRWFIKRFLVGGEWTLFGFRKVKEVVEEHGNGKVKFRGIEFDIVLCMSEPLVDSDDRYPPIDIVTANIKHPSFLRIQEPQASSVESIRIDSRITSKTSSILESSKCPTTSSDKADTKGYIEEWANPPRAVSGEVANGHSAGPKWISWILWWPTMLVLKHCQSPYLMELVELIWISDGRLPNSLIANTTSHLTTLCLILEVNYYRRVPTSAVFRNKGDVTG